MRTISRIITTAIVVGVTSATWADDTNPGTVLPAFEEAFRQSQCQAYRSVENVLKVRFTDLGSRLGAKRIRRKMKALTPTELDAHIWPLLQIGQFYVCTDAEKLALQHYDTLLDTLDTLPEQQNDLIRGPLHLWAGQAAYLRSKEKQATMFLGKALESCRLVKVPDSAVICEASAAVQLAQL
ncbi:hypothetical protein [Kordiimonas aestuarii]|uniref:hypothetical protein n=1 Tax=Kordiimonas aestuarii TaxID=1005925 RepID=UPI0021D1E69C|nr:hypothetical protein [Kordiimonas aestuarii]